MRSAVDHPWSPTGFAEHVPGPVGTAFDAVAADTVDPRTWQITEEHGKTVATAPDGLTRYTAEREEEELQLVRLPGVFRKASSAAEALGVTLTRLAPSDAWDVKPGPWRLDGLPDVDDSSAIHATNVDLTMRGGLEPVGDPDWYLSSATGDALTQHALLAGVDRGEGETDDALRSRTLQRLDPKPVYALTSRGRDWGLRDDPNKYEPHIQRLALQQGTIARVDTPAAERPMSEAPRDGTSILARTTVGTEIEFQWAPERAWSPEYPWRFSVPSGENGLPEHALVSWRPVAVKA